MAFVSYIEVNVIGFIILLLIYLNIKTRKEFFLLDRELFIALMVATAAMLVTDTMIWIIDWTPFPGGRTINLISSFLYYFIHPLPGLLWAFYADYKTHGSRVRLKKRILPLSIPFILHGMLAVYSLFGNFLFYVDQMSIYHRGKFFLVTVIISYGYLLYAAIQLILYRKKLGKHNFYTMLAFTLPPFLGGIIQYFVYGLTLIWICTTLSLLIIFINIQNDQLLTDHLTGLYNRRQLDNYLNWQLKYNIKCKLLAGIMLDMNNFKEINDHNGHMVGDEALEKAGSIIKNSVRSKDFVARYGGDEFVVIMEILCRSDVLNVIERINKNTELFNRTSGLSYRIGFSIGYNLFEKSEGLTVSQFLSDIDAMMYAEKWKNKE